MLLLRQLNLVVGSSMSHSGCLNGAFVYFCGACKCVKKLSESSQTGQKLTIQGVGLSFGFSILLICKGFVFFLKKAQ